MQGPHRVAGWRASWHGALPDRAAVLLIFGLSGLLWAAVVRAVARLVAGL